MEKVIRDGKVAVLISCSFGTGWFTWNTEVGEVLLFHPTLVRIVEAGYAHTITPEFMKRELGLADVNCHGAKDLGIVWLPVGTPFVIDDYDGSEYIVTPKNLIYTA
jgi:hypothetical protein